MKVRKLFLAFKPEVMIPSETTAGILIVGLRVDSECWEGFVLLLNAVLYSWDIPEGKDMIV